MLKTLLITLDFLPQSGGVANYWAGLNQYLKHNDFYILAPKIKSYSDESNILREKLLFEHWWLKWIKMIFVLINLKKKYNFKYFIAAQVLPVGTVLWFLKKIKFIDKYFVSCHGFDILHLQGRKKILANIILQTAEKIIANSNFTAGILNTKYSISAQKILILTPCPQIKLIELSKKLPRKDFLLKYKIITTARLVPRKGIDKMILSLPQIWERFPQIIYTIVGDGPDWERLQNLAKKIDSSHKKIIFTGRLADDELAHLYQKQDLFVMLPHNLNGDVEGFGMVYIEAGLFYLPVFATNSGGVSEAVKHNLTGILVPENSTSEFIAKNIIDLFSQPELLAKLGYNNHEWAVSFSWEKQAQKLTNILV